MQELTQTPFNLKPLGSDNALDVFYTLSFGRAEKKTIVQKD